MVAGRVRQRVAVHLHDLVVNGLAASTITPRHGRQALYRACGLRVMTHQVSPRCFLGGRSITIGRGTFVNYACFFDSLGPIVIGSDCAIGMNVQFITSTHHPGAAPSRAGLAHGVAIEVGDGCWIGAGALILPGVRVGARSIIAAGSVVTGDCDPDALYGGNPARKLRDLPSFERPGAGG